MRRERIGEHGGRASDGGASPNAHAFGLTRLYGHPLAVRRLWAISVLALLFVPSALSAWAEEGPTDTGFELPRPSSTQWIQVDGEAKISPRIRQAKFARTVAIDQLENGACRLTPRMVSVRASLLRFCANGQSMQTHSFDGTESAVEAYRWPECAGFWASAETNDDGLRMGFLQSNGVVGIPQKFFSDQELQLDPRRLLEDAWSIEGVSSADGILLGALAMIPGVWERGGERVRMIRLQRPPGLSLARGRLRVAHLIGDGRRHTFLVSFERKEEKRKGEHFGYSVAADGALAVREDGTLESGRLTLKAEIERHEGRMRSVASQDLLLRGHVKPIEENAAESFAQAVRLAQEDPNALAQAELEETLRTVRGILRKIRSDIDVDSYSVELWTDAPESTHSELPLTDTVATLEHVAAAGAAHFDAIQRFLPAGPKEGLPVLVYPRPTLTHPATRTVKIRPEHAGTMRHLLYALVEANHPRVGHPDLARFGVSGEQTDWAWTDLDGLLATTCIIDGLVMVHGQAALRRLFTPAEFSELLILVRRALNRRVPPMPDAKFQWAHLSGSGFSAVLQRLQAGDDPTRLTRRVWETASYQTRAILFPEDAAVTEPAALWPSAQELKTQHALGATHVGAYLTAWLLMQQGSHTPTQAYGVARSLEDDVLIQAKDGALWITQWADECAAETWLDLQSKVDAVSARGRYVVAQVGIVPEAEAWIGHLLPEASAEAPPVSDPP